MEDSIQFIHVAGFKRAVHPVVTVSMSCAEILAAGKDQGGPITIGWSAPSGGNACPVSAEDGPARGWSNGNRIGSMGSILCEKAFLWTWPKCNRKTPLCGQDERSSAAGK